MLEWFARKFIYPAPRVLDETPADYGTEFEEIEFTSGDGCQLHGWWLPHPQARATILICHANGENVASWAWVGAVLEHLHCNFLLFDYRGYGRSAGKPHQIGIYADALAAHAWLCASGNDQWPVIVWGRSLGSAIAIHVAANVQVAGLIAESGFTSMIEMATLVTPYPPFLVRRALRNNTFDALDEVRHVEGFKLFAHSPQDELIPYEMGQRLYEAAPEPKAFCKLTGGHNDPSLNQRPYLRAIEKLVNQVVEAQGD